MGVLCGILGRKDPSVVEAMARAMKHRGNAQHLREGKGYSIASDTPGPARSPCLIDGIPADSSGEKHNAASLRKACVTARKPAKLSLQGPFAAALRLSAEAGWWLLRDRLGIKPLYYFCGPGFLVFASELKGLLASGLVPKRLDLTSVDHYLTLRCVPGPNTIIQGVRRVKPGHAAVYDGASVKEIPFAQFHFDHVGLSKESAATQIRELLVRAVDASEAEGLLWSGGIDCAALGSLNPKLFALYIGLERAWQNERRLARESGKLLGLEFEERKAARLTESAMRKTLYALEEPVADASAFPLWLIFEEAARSGKRFMSGHGADELLGGYPRYHFLEKARGGAGRFIPTHLLAAMVPSLPPNAFIQRGGRYLARMGDNLGAYLSLLAVWDDKERDVLYTEAMKAAIHGQRESQEVVSKHFEDKELSQNQLAMDLNLVLPDTILPLCDRLAAAHGVTIEFPYLYDPLVDLINTLPPETKFGVRSKPLLRLAMKKDLPGRVRVRARRGFRVPQEGPVMAVVEQFAQHTVTPERVEESGLFKWSAVNRVLQTHSHNIYRRRQFWSLLMFFGWYREFMES